MPATNGPFIYDSLDKPNNGSGGKPNGNKDNATSSIMALGAFCVTLLFIALVLVYRILREKATYEYDRVAGIIADLLLYSPVLFLIALFVVVIMILTQQMRRLGWLDSFTHNVRVDDRQAPYDVFVNMERAKSLRSANWQTVTDSHDNTNTYKQTVEAKDEVPITEEQNQMDMSLFNLNANDADNA